MTSEKLPSIRKIIHIDMDAFFASVGCVIILNIVANLLLWVAPDQRGVVAAASYEARKFGSAMPAHTAIQRCPN
jgi:DNA polymerase-4